MAAQTKSRAARAAEQNEQDAIKAAEAGEIEPTAEAVEQAAAEQEQPQPEPEAKPEGKPTATYDLGHGRIVFYRPSLTLRDGTVTDCPHAQWGHEKEQHAMKCLRKLAAEQGVALAK
jgi:hypothetical protein